MSKPQSRLSVARRTFLAGTGAAIVARPDLSQAATVRTSGRSDLTLWYDRPASRWVEALPLGNGRLGAMVFGRVAQERIQLNEGTLWAGSPYDPNSPDALAALPQVRKLIDQGEFKQAQDLIAKTMMARPLSEMPYGTAGDIFLDFPGLETTGDYKRALDLTTALATTRFRVKGGTIAREVFASEPDQVIILHLTASGTARLNFDVNYRHPKTVESGPGAYHGAATPADMQAGSFDSQEQLERDKRPADLVITPDGARALLIKGHNTASANIPAGLTYALRLAAEGDGKITAEGDGIKVRGARAVTLVMAAATSFVNFARTDGDPVAQVRAQTSAASRKCYTALRSAHIAAHRRLFDRFAISLGKPSARAKDTTDKRINHVEENAGSLAALYVQYARYLMLSCSRGQGQAATLQGLWNDSTTPPWGSKYTININTEMNYWPVDAIHLSECYEPLIRLVEELSLAGAHTAKIMYGARGWVAHHNTDIWRAAAPVDGPFWGMWPMGGAWLCNTLWDHYDYVREPALLQRLYPLLKGASLFFVDALVEDPKGRGLVTSPSISPENAHHADVSICAGPAMDRQILRDLFDHTLTANRLLSNPDPDFAARLSATRARLPADRIGAQGQLQEWLDDWDAGAPEQQHRHVSHLYGVYPSGQINSKDTPDLIAAAKITLNTRGDLSTGWATAWRLCLWARMGEGERAYGILKGLLGPSRTYPNLFDAHPPFQIDGNFGGSAGILEMIVQSWGDEVHILPALPQDWSEGHIDGLKVRGGAELSLRWKNNTLQSLTVKGPANSDVVVRYGATRKVLRLDKTGHAKWG